MFWGFLVAVTAAFGAFRLGALTVWVSILSFVLKVLLSLGAVVLMFAASWRLIRSGNETLGAGNEK